LISLIEFIKDVLGWLSSPPDSTSSSSFSRFIGFSTFFSTLDSTFFGWFIGYKIYFIGS
jgi:hypothetical protein